MQADEAVEAQVGLQAERVDRHTVGDGVPFRLGELPPGDRQHPQPARRQVLDRGSGRRVGAGPAGARVTVEVG